MAALRLILSAAAILAGVLYGTLDPPAQWLAIAFFTFGVLSFPGLRRDFLSLDQARPQLRASITLRFRPAVREVAVVLFIIAVCFALLPEVATGHRPYIHDHHVHYFNAWVFKERLLFWQGFHGWSNEQFTGYPVGYFYPFGAYLWVFLVHCLTLGMLGFEGSLCASLPALLPRPEPRHLLRGPESLQYLGRSSRRSLPHFRLWRFSSWRLVLHGLDRSMASGLFLDFLASGTGLSGKGFANRVVAEHLNVGSFDIAGSALPSHPDLPGRSHGRPRRSPNLLMQIRSGLQSDIAPGHLHPSRHSRIIHLPTPLFYPS